MAKETVLLTIVATVEAVTIAATPPIEITTIFDESALPKTCITILFPSFLDF